MRSGNYIETYSKRVALTDNPVTWGWVGVLCLGLVIFPFFVNDYILTIAIGVFIAAVGAIGLNVLTGSTGLISLGQSGFLAVGAYACGLLITDYGWPVELAFLGSGVITALISLLVGIPSLRLKGLYLAITTLAFSFIITRFILFAEDLTHGPFGVRIEKPTFFGFDLSNDAHFYYFSLATVVLVTILVLNLLRSKIGRAWGAIRDHDIAAKSMGINLNRYKLLAFVVSSFIVGLAGAMTSLQIQFINVDVFSLLISIEALAMIIIGGLGSVAGAILGAIFITLLPEAVRYGIEFLDLDSSANISSYIFEVRGLMTGLLIILMLRIEPEGLIGVWRKTKRYWSNWPFSI
ncbi:MAG: branched-chain amino acid ABC transporter permease [Sneathiella sp.]